MSTTPGKQLSLSGQGQHVRGPTSHLYHLVAQQSFHNGGLERKKRQGALGTGPQASAPSVGDEIRSKRFSGSAVSF